MGVFHDRLGVPDTASLDEIKAAYKKLAKQNHPDLNPNDDNAEDRLKKINEAYHGLKENRHGPNGPSKPSHPNLEEILRQARENLKQGRSQLHNYVKIPIRVLKNGGKHTVSVPYIKSVNNEDRLTPSYAEVEILIQPNTKIGQSESIRFHTPSGNMTVKVIYVPDIPNGVELKSPNHLSVVAQTDLFKMVFGGKSVFETPWGDTLDMNIPENTPPGQIMVFTGRGLNHVEYGEGNLYVYLMPELPTLTSDQKEKISNTLKHIGYKLE